MDPISISKGFPLNISFDFDLLQPLKLTINFANVKNVKKIIFLSEDFPRLFSLLIFESSTKHYYMLSLQLLLAPKTCEV